MKSGSKLRVLTVLAGILTAVIIVVSQVFLYEVNVNSNDVPATEQSDKDSGEGQSFISIPSSLSIPSSVHVVGNHDFACIEEFLLGDNRDENTPVSITQITSRLFKTLFHFIISPNAP
ncbi:MAG: hypothetical protein MUE95_06405 [Cyclobacteriaceae bacterium]|jgi:hypothetical protein|nr:hypothetical protein [Cyclobacteriaceae bacterium]